MNANTKVLVAASLLLGTFACGEALPPKELLDARAAYERASQGKAGQLHPATVYEAKQALDKAEGKFKEVGEGAETKDLGYVAQRKAQYAEAQAELTAAQQAFQQADKDMRALTGKALESAQANLSKTKEELDKERQSLAREKENVAKAREETERERAARIEAEKRMRQAIEDLGKIAAIKQEQRGMVITLTGNVLYTSGKWDLLPGAQIKLNEVAEALKANKDRDIVVEGHTDNQGTAQSNLDLGQHRAESVRDYLVSRGVDSAQIKAVGIGLSRPVADNSTPEGRANNRRVEIIVSPPKEAR